MNQFNGVQNTSGFHHGGKSRHFLFFINLVAAFHTWSASFKFNGVQNTSGYIMEVKVLSVPYHSHCSLSHLIKNKTQNLHLMTAIKSNIVFRWNTIYLACIRQGFYHQNCFIDGGYRSTRRKLSTCRKWLSHWQTLSYNVVSSTPCLSRIWTHDFSDDRHWLHW